MREDREGWQEEAKTLKYHNIVLRNTIKQLKSPQLINKYEERGRQLAEQEFKRLLKRDRSQSGGSLKSKGVRRNKMITSGEGMIKESE